MSRWGMPAPWSRAPWMLMRQPAVALAVAAASFLVALPAAAASLFLSASGNATLQQQANTSCEWLVGAQWDQGLAFTPRLDRPGPFGKDLLDRRIKTAESLTAGVPRLSAPVVTTGRNAAVLPSSGPPATADQTRVFLVARDGFAEHVEVLSGGNGPGIWLADGFAAAGKLKAGDRVKVTMGAAAVTLPVAAVYRDLRSVPDQPYWCSLRDLIRGKPLGETPVLPLALVSREDFLNLAQAGEQDTSEMIEYAVDTAGLTTDSAAPTVDGLRQIRDRTVGASAPADNVFDQTAGTRYTSELSGFLDRARLVSSALVGTVLPLAAAGALAGLVIAAAAGAFWVDRRRKELAVLSARGVGPLALMGKAVLEVLAMVVLGAGAGWVAARFLVGALGPSPLFTPGSVAASAAGAGAAFLMTLAAIAVTSGRRTASLFDVRTTHVRRLPWELVPLLAAGAAWLLLGDGVDVGSATSGTVARIPPRLIVVPVLLIVGLAMLIGRLVRWALARSPSLSMRRPALFLAWRRVVTLPVAAAILVGATAVPVALSVYATTVTGSVDRTLTAESRLIIGSDVVMGLGDTATIPPELAGQASMVARYDSARIGGTTVNVLGVDPATFTKAAFWDPGLPGPSLDDLVSRLADPKHPAGALAGLSGAGGTLEINGRRLPLDITNVPQLPGKVSGYPLLLVHRDVLAALVPTARQQLWVRGDPDRIIPAAGRAGLRVATVSQARDVTATGVYAPITYTFDFLAAVSLLAGAIILVGLLLYLNARARARRSAYVLLRRMRIGAATHWRALLFEVGGLLLAGFTAGLALAGVVVALTYPGYDVNPRTVPGTIVDWPWALAGELAAAAIIVTVAATLVAQRTVSRARPAEVLRDAA